MCLADVIRFDILDEVNAPRGQSNGLREIKRSIGTGEHRMSPMSIEVRNPLQIVYSL